MRRLAYGNLLEEVEELHRDMTSELKVDRHVVTNYSFKFCTVKYSRNWTSKVMRAWLYCVGASMAPTLKSHLI